MGRAEPLRLADAALAYRGYDQVNLGRTPELLAAPAYAATVRQRLEEASALCAEAIGRRVDLVARVAERRVPGPDAYAEAVALVFAAEMAQVDLLQQVHGVDTANAALAFGYSLGELTALAAGGLYDLAEVMRPPLGLAEDCAALAQGATLAIVFSRQRMLDEGAIHALCEDVTCDGRGAIAVSAVLSPNTLLAIGQGDTVRELRRRLRDAGAEHAHVRAHDGVWPPLHTPLVRERNVPDRASLMIRAARRHALSPKPPIWSLVTGKREYERDSGREVLRRWVDSPQRLWDVVEAVLASDVRTVVHVGPAPNVIPATFHRLAENVTRQTLAWSLSGVGMRTIQVATRSWRAPLLPRRGMLLRAPMLRHVVLEDWLLEHAPA